MFPFCKAANATPPGPGTSAVFSKCSRSTQKFAQAATSSAYRFGVSLFTVMFFSLHLALVSFRLVNHEARVKRKVDYSRSGPAQPSGRAGHAWIPGESAARISQGSRLGRSLAAAVVLFARQARAPGIHPLGRNRARRRGPRAPRVRNDAAWPRGSRGCFRARRLDGSDRAPGFSHVARAFL